MNHEKRKHSIRKELAELHPEQAQEKGRLGTIEKLRNLFDEGSFVETDALISEAGNVFDNENRSLEGLVTAYGAIEGRLVFAFSQDYARNKGAIGIEGAKKIARLYKLALENGAAVVGIFDADGAKLQEGTNVLAAYGIILRAAAKAKHKIPRISIVTGNCSGANAVFALESDFLITAGEKASLSLSPISVLQGAGKKNEAGTAKSGSKSGLVSIRAASEIEGLISARKLLSYLPSNIKDKVPVHISNDPAERQVAEIASLSENSYDMRALITNLADNSSFFEVLTDYGKDFISAFAFINGSSCGIIASNPLEDEGRITAEGAKKASDFIEFCNAFSIPLISLVDSVGYSFESEIEKPEIIKHITKLAHNYARASMPMITVITGKAIGSVFSVLGSKMLGADLVLALPSAQIAVMDTDAAINFLWNDKLSKADDAKTAREELKNEWEQEMSTPLNAAKNGHIDFICEEKELRARIASALSMLSMKRNFNDFI